jgi:hypothetical protein
MQATQTTTCCHVLSYFINKSNHFYYYYENEKPSEPKWMAIKSFVSSTSKLEYAGNFNRLKLKTFHLSVSQSVNKRKNNNNNNKAQVELWLVRRKLSLGNIEKCIPSARRGQPIIIGSVRLLLLSLQLMRLYCRQSHNIKTLFAIESLQLSKPALHIHRAWQ